MSALLSPAPLFSFSPDQPPHLNQAAPLATTHPLPLSPLSVLLHNLAWGPGRTRPCQRLPRSSLAPGHLPKSENEFAIDADGGILWQAPLKAHGGGPLQTTQGSLRRVPGIPP